MVFKLFSRKFCGGFQAYWTTSCIYIQINLVRRVDASEILHHLKFIDTIYTQTCHIYIYTLCILGYGYVYHLPPYINSFVFPDFLTINSNLCPCRRVWLDIIVSWHVFASPWCGANFDVVSLCSRAPWATYSYLQAGGNLDVSRWVREEFPGKPPEVTSWQGGPLISDIKCLLKMGKDWLYVCIIFVWEANC